MYSHVHLHASDDVAVSYVDRRVTKCTYEQRRQHLHFGCTQRLTDATAQQPASLARLLSMPDNILKRLAKTSTILVDSEHKLVYCYAGKVGSTTYKTLLMKHSAKHKQKYRDSDRGLPTSGRAHFASTWSRYGLHVLGSYSIAEIRHILATYTKMLMARHPLVRVYSFYRDKLDPKNSCCHALAKSVRKWVHMYRKGSNKTNSTIQHIDRGRSRNDTGLTFAEFAQYFASHRDMLQDAHLKPLSVRCQPCVIPYDVVLKLETAESDQAFFVNTLLQSGTHHDALHKNAKMYLSEAKALENGFSRGLAAYDAIPLATVESIMQYYKLDFNLFGYDTVLERGQPVSLRCHSGNKQCC